MSRFAVSTYWNSRPKGHICAAHLSAPTQPFGAPSGHSSRGGVAQPALGDEQKPPHSTSQGGHAWVQVPVLALVLL